MESDFDNWAESQREYNGIYDSIHVPHANVNVLEVEIVESIDKTQSKHGNEERRPYSHVIIECTKAQGNTILQTQKRRARNSKIVWNEKFRFVLPPGTEEAELKLSVAIDNWRGAPIITEQYIFNYNHTDATANMEGNILIGKEQQMLTRLSMTQETQIRFSHGLSDDEMQFRLKRIPKVMTSLTKLFHSDDAPKSLFETPVMSIVGSGGGLRAACAVGGFIEALDEIGLLDCITYAFGTSGSSWHLIGAYTRKAVRGASRSEYHQWLRNSFKKSAFLELIRISNIKSARKICKEKKQLGQPFTLVDFYGKAVSRKLFGETYGNMMLSDIRGYVETADVPFPILNCTQVQDMIDVRKYRADVEISPFECVLPQYGINVDTRYINSRFTRGVMQQQLPEPKLSFISGTLGSVFGMRLNRILGLEIYEEDRANSTGNAQDSTAVGIPIDSYWTRFLKWVTSLPQFLGRNMIIQRTGQILNFAKDLPDMKRFRIDPLSSDEHSEAVDGFREKEDILSLVDGGILCNVAIDAALRPQRKNDILFIADFSDYDKDVNFETLESAIRLANIGKYKFPPVDLEKIKREKLKELYVFEDENDPDCPTVFWFLLDTDKFSQDLSYTPQNYEVLEQIPKGRKFTDFKVYGSDIYDTFNTVYTSLDFDRLKELAAYNVKINEKVLKEKVMKKILSKRAKLR